jgi:hypothetical protein
VSFPVSTDTLTLSKPGQAHWTGRARRRAAEPPGCRAAAAEVSHHRRRLPICPAAACGCAPAWTQDITRTLWGARSPRARELRR